MKDKGKACQEMHIIFIIASMGGGGSERVISALSEQFIRWQHDVTIIMTAGNEIAYTLDARIKVKQIGGQTGGSLQKRLSRIAELRKLVKRNKNALFISFGTETNLFCILAGFGIKKRMILSERNDPNQCSYKTARDMIYSLGNRFAFQTDAAKECFSRAIQKRSTVIPNPILQQIPERFTGKRDKTVVAVGRLTKQKNHALLLQAFKLFWEKHPEYRLIIYGQGELEAELRNLSCSLNLDSAIVLAGFSKDIIEKIKTAGMYVLSSDYEGISNSMVEAMAVGVPVIATDCPIGGARLCIEDGVNGLLVPVGDKEAMASAMSKLADNPHFADRLSKKAVEIHKRFSLENIAAQWLELGEERF